MRNDPDPMEPHWFGGLRYSPERRCVVRRDGTEAFLRPRSLAVFRRLSQQPGTVVSKDALLQAAWPNVIVTDDSVTQCIVDIRRALGDDARHVLRTVPRQGYLMTPDAAPPAADTAAANRADGGLAGGAAAGRKAGNPALEPRDRTRWAAWLGAGVAAALVGWLAWADRPATRPSPPPAPISSATAHAPTVSLRFVRSERGTAASVLDAVAAELRIVLSHYPTVRLVEGGEADYRLTIHAVADDPPRLAVEAHGAAERRVIFAESYDVAEGRQGIHQVAARIAAFASPAGGALSRHLMAGARHKPVEALSHAECFAHAYDCSSCSGELETVTTRAQQCLTSILAKDPDDATAWGLQAAVHAVQWRFGFSLSEPERSDLLQRARRIDMAIEAANRAEALSDGNNTAVYWGMVQAYFARCDVGRMRTAIQRGLAINPDDPALLAAFGNWMVNTGQLEEGRALIERALAIEPQRHPAWWLFGLGNRHFYRGEFQQAQAIWLRAFNDRNWISANQLAYTLPHLGRLDEAQQAVRRMLALYPGFTVEKALQFYKASCFGDPYLTTMQAGLKQAGLPSRVPDPSPRRIEVPRVSVRTVNGFPVEYLDLGRGEPIVFLHGAVADYRGWADFELPISARQRFISFSQRCFGSQPGSCRQPPETFQAYVDDLAAFIEMLRSGPVHLVGWSSGAKVAALLSATRPELVKSAVLFEPVETALASAENPEVAEAGRLHQARFGPVAAAMKVSDHFGAAARFLEWAWEQPVGDFDRERAATQRVISENMAPGTLKLLAVYSGAPQLTCELLAQTRVPTLVMRGERTGAWWRTMADRAAECIPGAELSIVSGVRHDAPMRKPHEMAETILAFVERHAAPAHLARSSGEGNGPAR